MFQSLNVPNLGSVRFLMFFKISYAHPGLFLIQQYVKYYHSKYFILISNLFLWCKADSSLIFTDPSEIIWNIYSYFYYSWKQLCWLLFLWKPWYIFSPRIFWWI